MNYLMTFDTIKRPLRISNKPSAFAISAGSLGTMYPVLVDPSEDYATPLRIKYNNQVKAFASMPSVLLAKSFVLKTGSLLEEPTDFPSGWDTSTARQYDKLSYYKLFYDKYEGAYIALSSETSTLISKDGKKWRRYLYGMGGQTITSAVDSSVYGLVTAALREEEVYEGSRLAGYNYYLQIRIHQVEGEPVLLHEEFMEYVSDIASPFSVSVDLFVFPDLVHAVIGNEQFGYETDCPLLYTMVSFSNSSQSWSIHSQKTNFFYLAKGVLGNLFIAKASSFDSDAVYNKSYNYNYKLKTMEFYRHVTSTENTTLYTKDGKTFYTPDTLPYTYRHSIGNINGYEIFDDPNSDGVYLSADGVNNTLHSTKGICGYDPVDNTYIHQFKYLKTVGPSREYKVLLDIYTSRDLQNWTLVEQLDYGMTERWVPEEIGSAINMYYVMGFTDN